MKKIINEVARSVTFTFGDGLDSVTLGMDVVSPEAQQYAMLHGFAARIGDNAAIQKSAENNFTVTEAMRREAVLEMVMHYASGTKDWNMRPSARAAKQNPAIAAIAAKRGTTYAEAEAWFNEKLMAELAAE